VFKEDRKRKGGGGEEVLKANFILSIMGNCPCKNIDQFTTGDIHVWLSTPV
jgi:hypothetical protein